MITSAGGIATSHMKNRIRNGMALGKDLLVQFGKGDGLWQKTDIVCRIPDSYLDMMERRMK